MTTMESLKAKLNAQNFNTPRKTIQTLFLQGKHRQCIKACSQALDAQGVEVMLIGLQLTITRRRLTQMQPVHLHIAFLYFYGAISFEALARNMHNQSPTLDATLNKARECFVAADQALSKSSCTQELTLWHESGTATASGVVEEEALETSSNRSSNASYLSTASQASSVTSAPSRRSSVHVGQSELKAGGPAPALDPRSRDPRRQRYEEDLLDFHHMLQKHLLMLTDLRTTKFAKRKVETKAPTSFAPYMHPGFRMNIESGGWQKPKMGTDEKLERIRRGRERKWQRERFDATRYQNLCTAALVELHVVSTN